MITEINPQQINLKSFVPKKELNPSFFEKDGKLKSEIRLRLLDIADTFWADLGIDGVKPEDIVVTGSIVNYNWSKYSDVDVHIIVDFAKICDGNTELVDNYFYASKQNWNKEHNIEIEGYEVELYVEDVNADSESSGIYSLNKDKWVIEPQQFNNIELHQKKLKKLSSKIINKVDELEAYSNNELLPEPKIDKVIAQLDAIFDKMSNMRKEDLHTEDKEFSFGNLLWKVMRRAGYIDKIKDITNKLYDRKMSLHTI